MKRLAGNYILTLVAIVAALLLPQAAFAETVINESNNGDGSSSNVSVNSQQSGQSTVCVNGKCTTTGGGGKTTVCINGHCTTTEDGNVDMQSEDGHSQVHVHNNTSGNSSNISPEPTESVTPKPTTSEEPSVTPDPTIMQMRKDLNSQVKKEIEGVKEHVKNQNAAISDFIKAEMQALQIFLNSMFK